MNKKPWYREPYVWLVILFPASAVIGGMVTISMAINSDDGLVVDDYYKQGLEINRVLERDKAAIKHGLHATLNLTDQLIQVQLDKNSDYNLPKQIAIRLSHHTRSGFDTEFIIDRVSDNIYQTKVPQLIAGEWYVQIAADDWRLLQSIRTK
ncbi:FixH family protein [Candidatus Halobeggiatoa sp. HSG11]|nr:FixH family protein [Candidatus Halobeggiatoa sp. HSG11]